MMPAIDVAMERSLRRGFLDLLVGSLRPAFGRRDITGEISDVKTAFSSWDNCIQVNYCKYVDLVFSGCFLRLVLTR
jgi:hypothetical protein